MSDAVLVALIASMAPTITALLVWWSQHRANVITLAAAEEAKEAAKEHKASLAEVEHNVNSRLDALLDVNKALETEIRRLNAPDASNTPAAGRNIGRPPPVTLDEDTVNVTKKPDS